VTIVGGAMMVDTEQENMQKLFTAPEQKCVRFFQYSYSRYDFGLFKFTVRYTPFASFCSLSYFPPGSTQVNTA